MQHEFQMNESLGYLVARVHWCMKTNFQRLIKQRGLQVTPEQWAVLRFVFEFPGISQAEIARRSLKDKTNITRILDVLAKYGYIRRQDDEHDRRGYNIFLTDEGETVLQQLIPLAKQSNISSTQELSAEELRTLLALLQKVGNTLERVLFDEPVSSQE